MAEIRNPYHQLFYRALRAAAVSLLYSAYRWQVIGRNHVPLTGPVVLASNHIDNFDPILIGSSTPRFVHFMAKEELFHGKLVERFLRYVGAFPIRRGSGDRGAIKHALAVIEQGQCLTVFPEGHRSRNGVLGRGLPGVAMIARRANCPVVPVVVIGPYRFRGKLTVRFGQPIPPDPDITNEALLAKLMTELQFLLDEGHAP